MAQTYEKSEGTYIVTKHSWKGKYKRVLVIRKDGICTFNPSSMESTNSWSFSDFVSIPISKSIGNSNEFQLVFKKGIKKTDTIKLSSEFRAQIVSDVYKHSLTEAFPSYLTWVSHKYHWSESRIPTIIRLGPHSLDQIHPLTNFLLSSYNYMDIEAIIDITDYPNGFAIKTSSFGRLHLFDSDGKTAIISKLTQFASNYIGVTIQSSISTTLKSALSQKFGKFSDDDVSLTSLFEFIVFKQSTRSSESIRRKLCLSETCLLERDIATYSIVSLTPLVIISALIRDEDNPQRFTIMYNSGKLRSYVSNDRDSLLASFLDCVRASGNRDIHIRRASLDLTKRLGPLDIPVDEEVESSHLRFLANPPLGWSFSEAVIRFNANISYSGLLHAITQEHLFAENKEKLIYGAINQLINHESNEDFYEEFQGLRRLVASKLGFASFTNIGSMREKVGLKVIRALKTNEYSICHAAIDLICALMEPMHEDYDLRQEQLNKSSLLSSVSFLEGLMDMWTSHVNRGTGALVVSAMLDMLTFALCSPYSETTDGKQFDIILEQLSLRGRTLFRLFQHPSLTIVKGAGLLMKALIEEGSVIIGRKMQRLALAEGSLPIHLLTALYTKSSDDRLQTHVQLSRHLISLWVSDNEEAMNLLSRILPSGLLEYLSSSATTPTSDVDRLHVRDNLSLAIKDADRKQSHALLQAAGKGLKLAKQSLSKTAEVVGEKTMRFSEESRRIAEKQFEIAMQHWRTKMGKEWTNRQNESYDKHSSGLPTKVQERPIILRKRREQFKSQSNWSLFYFQFHLNHSKPNLIWNLKTRQELQNVLETEIASFKQDRELGGAVPISWNYKEFEVHYTSFSDEIQIGDYFLRLLLEEESNTEEDRIYINNPFSFFNDLYHRFLLTPKTEMKCLCLQALTIVYGKHVKEIGSFADTKYIVAMLERTTDFLERDRLLLFLHKLLLHQDNAVQVVQGSGSKILMDFLPLAHLHNNRAILNTRSNAIQVESSERFQEKEWYYGSGEKERNGPVSLKELKDLMTQKILSSKSKIWAQGLESWKFLHQVPQLKWTLLGKGTCILNESEVTGLILDMLLIIIQYYPSRDQDGSIVRPLPKIKTHLSDPAMIHHIVQCLLTFDPSIVEKVSSLLYLLYEDNPRLSSLYLTGLFFFILMYMGSNLNSIAELLFMTHLKQAFRSEETSDIMRRSILGQILPEAMVAFLCNHGPSKFSQIFLGEFDTPEVIWNNEMRQFMIQKLAYHISDFSPRLKSNIRALYQYCPIPLIAYPNLQNELFCDIYYLRNLCNEDKFADWPIESPLQLLKEVLHAWRKEVDKKPASMTIKEALDTLGLNSTQYNESDVRKHYFKMAQKYHPDKNPTGRAFFEQVNSAYTFLCNKSELDGAPNPHNIVLILRAQSILFKRFVDVLHPYKYSGYPMLIATIRMETEDDKLFSKSAPLLAAASEVAYHTVNCSALNAEELRRENGLEILYDAFERCVSVLSRSSKPEDIAVSVCTNIIKTYSVASQFQSCLDKMIEMSDLVKNICRVFYYEHLSAFCGTAAECVSSLAHDPILQMHLLQAGSLWHLLLFLFQYDYTLEESGIDVAVESNTQAVSNHLAKLSLEAVSSLAGLVEIQSSKKSPKNSLIEECLSAMLTHYIVDKIKKNEKSSLLLKILNSNSETPYLIWNNSTRAELTEYLKIQRDSSIRRGYSDPSFGAEFVFTAHKDELVIGNIFIRLYNQQPSFTLEDPKAFMLSLLDYLNHGAQYFFSLLSLDDVNPPEDKILNLQSCLASLLHVIIHNKDLENITIGHFRMLFNLLRLERCYQIQEYTLQLLFHLAKNQAVVSDIANSHIMIYLLKLIYDLKSNKRILSLDVLFALMVDTKLVRESYNMGGIVLLISVFCGDKDEQCRERAAEILCRMISDKLIGPKVHIGIVKFLPEIFIDGFKQSSSVAITMYESNHENPELIWNDESRSLLKNAIKSLGAKHYEYLNSSSENSSWNMDAEIQYLHLSTELVIGGIYIRLFNENPGWVLRKPREFVSDLFEVILTEMKKKSSNVIESVTSAMVKLLEIQSNLADYIPSTGYISRLLFSMKSGEMQKYGIRILNELANSFDCVECLSSSDFAISVLQKSMKNSTESLGLSCQLFSKLFNGSKVVDTLVKQGLDSGLIPDLLNLLSSSSLDSSTNRAYIVKALKSMESSLLYGSYVTELLTQNPNWSRYNSQKHDLFIEDRQNVGYLTTTPGLAGYLTSGHSSTILSQPPPLEENKNTDDESPLF